MPKLRVIVLRSLNGWNLPVSGDGIEKRGHGLAQRMRLGGKDEGKCKKLLLALDAQCCLRG